jgi:hypothetical protein
MEIITKTVPAKFKPIQVSFTIENETQLHALQEMAFHNSSIPAKVFDDRPGNLGKRRECGKFLGNLYKSLLFQD